MNGTVSSRSPTTSSIDTLSVVDYFGGTEQQPGAPPRRMRLVTFVVSEFGSFGEQAAALVRALASRVGRSVPSSLIDESSWATPSFAPFARSAIALIVQYCLYAHPGWPESRIVVWAAAASRNPSPLIVVAGSSSVNKRLGTAPAVARLESWLAGAWQRSHCASSLSPPIPTAILVCVPTTH